MTNPLAIFQNLLRELFQFDCADLDFGIYRIMNRKREVIERFITDDLPKAVAEQLDSGALADQAQAAAELEEATQQIRSTLARDAIDADGNLVKFQDTDIGKKYIALRAKVGGKQGHDALEAAIFNHLYAFFSRYYQDGDFISKRRYSKRQRYAIPYNGEEVHLHWANSDQYYIKTGEHFRDYSFAVRDITVHFKLQVADVEQDNVKGDKRFFLPGAEAPAWDAEAKRLDLPFEYRPLTEQEGITYGKKNQQEAIITKAVAEIPKQLDEVPDALAALTGEIRRKDDGQAVSFLEHHLRQYTRRNTSDFFVHKDLKGFFSRELDFYLKNEVLNLDEMEAAGEDRAEGWFQMMRVIKSVGGQIIDFLDQIENFQKMLWEKRKFVTETQYCIAVGHIDGGFYEDIAGCEAQWDEWKTLFGIDEDRIDLFNLGKDKIGKRVEFLKARPTLVLDTKHFDQGFVDRLLGDFSDLAKMTDGVLIHSENGQALNLLQERYREQVKCIYIDPPYNTGTDGFLYKDGYQHSSWITLLESRIAMSKRLLQSDGLFFSSIDDIEVHNLRHLTDDLFGAKHFVGTITWVSTTQPDNIGRARFGLQQNIEYVLFHAVCERVALPPFVLKHSGQAKKYPHRGQFGACRFEIIERAFEGAYARPTMQFKILGQSPRQGKQWQIGEATARSLEAAGKVEIVDGIVKRAVYPEDEEDADTGLIPFWAHLSETGTSQTGKAELTDIIGRGHGLDTVKPVSLLMRLIEHIQRSGSIMDYFAGSGTTGHAVINLNREDGGQRKFILVEMGKYFDTLLLPRIKKVAFTPKWKDGKPKRMAKSHEAKRGPRIVKYMRLESYEDALNNIDFDEDAAQQALQFDDYLLKYMLQWETKRSATLLNVEKLSQPFRYTLHIHADGQTRQQIADIPETFNYLLGLRVETRRVYYDDDRRYLVYRGQVDQQRVAVIWRETQGWDKAALVRDKEFVAEQQLTDGADEVYVNGDSFIREAKALEPVFKRRMFAERGE